MTQIFVDVFSQYPAGHVATHVIPSTKRALFIVHSVHSFAFGPVQNAQSRLHPSQFYVVVFSQYAAGQIGSHVIPSGCNVLLRVHAVQGLRAAVVQAAQYV